MGGTFVVDATAGQESAVQADAPSYSAVQTVSGESGLFVANQVMIASADVNKVRDLMATESMAGMRLNPLPTFTPPPGVAVSTDPARSNPPAVALLEFDGAPLGSTEGVVLEGATEGGSVSSTAALGTLVRVQQLQELGIRASLDWAGQSHALPATTASDASGDCYTWPEFNGPTAFVRAWQLIAAHRLLGGAVTPVQIAMIDSGFWYDRGTGACLGTPPEFPGYVPQLDVINGQPRAGGTALEPPVTWHGQLTTGVAMAPHDNAAGTGGAAGNLPGVVTPFLFRTTYNQWKVMSALKTATAWGCDVANMSFGINPGTFLGMDSFHDDAWNEVFVWAHNCGVVLVCSAGNDRKNLHELNTRPATRTEKVITVGALAVNTADRAWVSSTDGKGSNWNESVDLWAPGEALHCGPEPENPTGSRPSGTSGSAPLVSAAAALVKAVAPGLSATAVWDILRTTAYSTAAADPKVGIRLNAGAAVWKAMGEKLPRDLSEGNDSPARATPLVRDATGRLVPPGGGPRALSEVLDKDWYVFDVPAASGLRITLDHTPGLDPSGAVPGVYLKPADEQAELDGLTTTVGAAHHEVDVAVAPPGTYRLIVMGGQSIYDLAVTVTGIGLEPDEYEPNDTLDSATRFSMRPPIDLLSPSPIDPGGPAVVEVPGLPPGSYEMNLTAGDVDHLYVNTVPEGAGPVKPWIFASSRDVPIHVEVLDTHGRPLREDDGFHTSCQLQLQHPACYVRITTRTGQPTRYSFLLKEMVDVTDIPVY